MGYKAKMYLDYQVLHDEVTGSCIYCTLHLPNRVIKFLVDCGLFQEKDYLERNQAFPFEPKDFEYVFLTHIHADHCARIPMLYHRGYRGKVYTSYISKELLPITLTNSCRLLSAQAAKEHKSLLYTEEDLKTTIDNTVGHVYNEFIKVDNNISIMFLGNGHLLGAACIYMRISYPGEEDINVLFTGDYSPCNTFFEVLDIPDEILSKPVTIIQETTYGYMHSREIKRTLENNVKQAIKENKTIVFPAFAIGRYQEIEHLVQNWMKSGLIPKRYKVYLDGSMPFEYNEKYTKFAPILKPNMRKFVPKDAKRVKATTEVDEKKSKKKKLKKNKNELKVIARDTVINSRKPKIIIATSGMGTYGPSYEYITSLKYRSDVLIHFLGYLAEGTLGRILQDEEAYKQKHGLDFKENEEHAQIKFTNELSFHAKKDELLDFLKKFRKINCLLLNHGNFDSTKKYHEYVKKRITIKDIETLNSSTVYRIGAYGFIKSFTKAA